MPGALYIDRPSPLHGLDPRTKMVCMLFLSTVLFVFNDPRYVAGDVIVLVSLAALGRCIINVARFKSIFAIVFIVNVVLWPFYVSGGAVLLRAGPLTVTNDGLLYALAVGMRFSGLLVTGVIFLSCTKTEEIVIGLQKLRIPYTLSFVIALVLRLVPTFTSAFTTIMEAQVARGLDVATRNPVLRMRRTFPVIVPMVMYALRNISTMSHALEARGFTPNARRTSYLEISPTARDAWVTAIMVLIFTGCLTLRLTGHGAIIPGRI